MVRLPPTDVVAAGPVSASFSVVGVEAARRWSRAAVEIGAEADLPIRLRLAGQHVEAAWSCRRRSGRRCRGGRRARCGARGRRPASARRASCDPSASMTSLPEVSPAETVNFTAPERAAARAAAPQRLQRPHPSELRERRAVTPYRTQSSSAAILRSSLCRSRSSCSKIVSRQASKPRSRCRGVGRHRGRARALRATASPGTAGRG